MIAHARRFDDEPESREGERGLQRGPTYEAFLSRWFVAAMAPTVYRPSAQSERVRDSDITPTACPRG